MSYTLLSDIFRKPWAIEPMFAATAGKAVVNILSGQNAFPDMKSKTPTIRGFVDNNTPENTKKTALIPIQGALMKYDQECGPAGTKTIGNWINDADNNPEIDSIVLIIDSPGGTVDGTEELANIIASTSKQTIAFVDGMAASAALWIASAANKIIAATDFSEIGSIGVMTSFVNMRPMWEKQGVKFLDIFASQSKDKNRNFLDLLEGKTENYTKEVLDPLADHFIATMKTNRPKIKESQLSGKMYHAKDVLGSLVDDIGTLDYAIAQSFEIQNSNSNININQKSKQMAENKNSSAPDENWLTSFIHNKFGLNPVDKNAEKKAEIDALKAQLQEAQKSAEQKTADLQAQLEKLTAELKEVKKLPAAQTSTVSKQTDANTPADPYSIDLGDGTVQEQYFSFKNALNQK